MKSYKNNYEYIIDEFILLDMILMLRVIENLHSANQISWNFLSNDEIKSMTSVENQKADDQPDNAGNADSSSLIEKIESKQREISQKLEASVKSGVMLNLSHVAARFNLSRFETEALLLCRLFLSDSKYREIFKKISPGSDAQPDIDTILKILCSTEEERFAAGKYFSEKSNLFANGLLEFDNSGIYSHLQYPFRPVSISRRIAEFITGNDNADDEISSFTKIYSENNIPENMILPDKQGRELRRYADLLKVVNLSEDKGTVFAFNGPRGTGKKTFAAALCKEIKRPLLAIDLKAMSAEGKINERMLRIIRRESILLNAGIYFDNAESVISSDEKGYFFREMLNEIFEKDTSIIFFGSSDPFDLKGFFQEMHYYSISFDVPDFSTRVSLCVSLLKNYSISDNIDIKSLCNNYRLTQEQICNAVLSARDSALMDPEAVITTEDLTHGFRSQVNSVHSLSCKVDSIYKWNDLILPEEQMEQLQEVISHVKHKHIVFDEWEFGSKHSYGTGLNILFHGTSGTGKTMAAGIISNELQLDLYKIDLSNIVSKYIGETEKNLSRIFAEAEAGNSILFFDEADALFGRRTGISDSHDRYANIEVGYLLQKMEEYTGIVILATNMKKNMDEAFIRRMRFIIEFPFPDVNYRKKIWEKCFPGNAPLDKDVDFDYIAQNLNVAGGNIKNIALSSAFYAASGNKAISLKDIIQAGKREYQKIGKPFRKSNFEESGLEKN